MQIILSRKAEIALRLLSPSASRIVREALRLLQGYPHDEYLMSYIKELPDYTDLYVMRAGPYRIIFADRGDQLEIMDIVPYSRLKQMFD
jgi:mRNA-degrading endonuclease RelE of RelBE toxin-antitoxin system